LSVCGVVACEPGTCDADEGVLLQAKSLIRKHKASPVIDAADDHIGETCWNECSRLSGFCDWCGSGNACCRQIWSGDQPAECDRAVHSGLLARHHECVTIGPVTEINDPAVSGSTEEFDSRLSAYWESGNCGAEGNDWNWHWCGQRAGNCPTTISTLICDSGDAELAEYHGTGEANSYTRDGCNYFWHAQYRCTEAENAHLGVTASNFCTTESVSEAECLDAVRALLPEGQAQGRQNLVAGSWGHVPPGCSVQSRGDWAAHYNRRDSGSNDGGYTPVCSGQEAVTGSAESIWELITHHEVSAGYFPNSARTSFTHNADDPSASLFMNIGQLTSDDYFTDGKYHFRLVYGNVVQAHAPCNDGPALSGDTQEFEWTQTNWITESSSGTVEAMSPADLAASPNAGCVFNGLARSSDARTVFDGSQNHDWWFQSVGSNREWHGGIPAFKGGDAQSVSLYVRKPTPPAIDLWAQHLLGGAADDRRKCNGNVDMVYVADQAACQARAIARGHSFYSFNHNSVSQGYKCMSSADCDNHLEARSQQELWHVYAENAAPSVPAYRYADMGSGDACPTSDVSEEECLAAVQSLLPVGQSQGRTNLVTGSWRWVPPGCSVQSHFTRGQNGDWAAHFNRGSGNNDGGYSKVCHTAFVQLKYMNPDVGANGLCVSMTANLRDGAGCSTSSCLNNGASDATLQVCDSMDAGQMFSHDASTGLLHSAMTGNSNRCLTVGQSNTHGACEPFTLANCDAGSNRQQFDMEAVAGSSDQKVWRNIATGLAIDSDSYRNTVDNWIWACPGTNTAKYFGAVSGDAAEDHIGETCWSETIGQCRGGANFPGISTLWNCIEDEDNNPVLMTKDDCEHQCESHASCDAFDRNRPSGTLSQCCLFTDGNTGSGKDNWYCYVKRDC